MIKLHKLFDTHCHLDAPDFDHDRIQVLQQSAAIGISGIVIPATHAMGWQKILALCATQNLAGPKLYAALGLHPIYLQSHQDSDLHTLETLLAEYQPLAIGEIGLDYFISALDRTEQQRLFAAQLKIAQSARLPVLLHVRKAHDQTLTILKKFKLCGGIVHAFNGSIQQAQQYYDLGFYLGLGGMLTFSRSTKLHKLAAALPLDSFVLETDAPDLTVASHRGERNSPAYLPEVLATLAQIRDINYYELAFITTNNALRVLKLS